MASPIIYGPNFSTYVRTTRLVLTEKPAPYQLTEIAFMEGAHKQDEFLQRNPFGMHEVARQRARDVVVDEFRAGGPSADRRHCRDCDQRNGSADHPPGPCTHV